MIDAGTPAPEPGVVRRTTTARRLGADVQRSPVVGLYRTGRIEAMMHDLLHEVTPEGIVFIAFPPDEAGDMEAIAAGLAAGLAALVHAGRRRLIDAAARERS